MIDWKKCSTDPLPDKAIRISEAFDRVREALTAKSDALKTLSAAKLKFLCQAKEEEARLQRSQRLSQKSLAALHHGKEAVVFFRDSLERGELTTYIRDPEDGAILQLDSLDWHPMGGRLLLSEPPYAFEEDFLENDPFSGNPNTFIRGAFRPVFLWRKDFELWLSKTFGQRHSGGRPTGSGSYEAADMPFLDRMRDLRRTGAAKSIYDAAVQVAKDVPLNNATEQSIITRLAKRYSTMFGSDEK